MRGIWNKLSQNYLILAGSSKLLVRQHDGVEQDHLARDDHVAAEDGDGGVQLAVDVEQWVVLHLGERLVRVGILGGSLHSRPGAHTGVPADHAVEHQGVFSYLRVPCRQNLYKTQTWEHFLFLTQHDTFFYSCSGSNFNVFSDTNVWSQDGSLVYSSSLMNKNISYDCWGGFLLCWPGQSLGVCFIIERQEMSVGIDSAARSLDLTPPVGSQVEEGLVSSGQRNQNVSLHPDRLSLAVLVVSLAGGEILNLLGVENILKRNK